MKRLITIIIAMFVLLPLSAQRTHAFWAENVSYSEVVSTATIQIGEWFFAPVWESNPDTNYIEGDVVFWEGNYYTRTSKGMGNQNSEPGTPGSWNFWDETDDG